MSWKKEYERSIAYKEIIMPNLHITEKQIDEAPEFIKKEFLYYKNLCKQKE
tara:strand:- start:10669 stop:10821 length:153 start_codon:yes stop_codon:yes gene_type:complete